MRSYTRTVCGLLVAAVTALAGCANDDKPSAVHASDLGDKTKGEVLVPYEPLVVHKITQDPSQFQMPAVQSPATAPVPAEAPAAAVPAAGAEPAAGAAPSEPAGATTPDTAAPPSSPETPAAPAPATETPAADPARTDAPAAPSRSGSGSANMDLLPPTAPAPVGGLGN